MVIIEYQFKKQLNKVEKLIEQKHAEHLISNVRIRDVLELAYKNWTLDYAKAVVALNLTNGELIGYSVSSTQKHHRSDSQIIIFELDANVDVEDVSVLLGNMGVKAVRSFFEIDDETFSNNMFFWTECYLRFHNLTIKSIRDSFLRVLYNDYKQTFYNTCIKKQLDYIYTYYYVNNNQ
ncbi:MULTISPECIES: hypothetical protein [unclassified Bacillus (in: firmicutes)]|uniref:hypothetical protein n=1 Tax=unclassified Bacillus (in: firmicutes) TaxID=185979 RepID=UPI000BF19642|nr:MULTISPECIES: hypothetical protein [unclassified Bacillus (in: firmicutes)]PEJ60201.1 hypothetical protein CN692_02605 [Bacillus sp. AFS002410]PEL10783.1 hypothetical protein CN601_13670 [Bacillus sp. AFS017336]